MLDLVSVVIPTYNRSEELKRALESVLSQTYKNFEVIVVDNNSTDDTDAMLKSLNDQRIRLLKIKNNGVIAASRNLGINSSSGEWIAFLDSDDWWHSNKLEKVMCYCNSGYDVCYHDLKIFSSQRKFSLYQKKMSGYQVKKPVFNDLIQLGNALSNSSVVVRAALIKQIGGLCEDRRLIASEDYECWIRLSKLTNKFKYIPETLGCYWIGVANTTSATLSLANLQYINKLHIAKFNEENNSESPAWWMYAYARALYLTGDTLNARNLLKELTKRHISLTIRLKSYYMILVSK
jgi:glycosyltransferase involved in cell wall biosynthesis